MVTNDGTWYTIARYNKRPWDYAHRLRARDAQEMDERYMDLRTTKCGKRGRAIHLPVGAEINACEKCRIR